ncbi:hypothetical protein ACKQC9_28030, partial [Klebsiella michiganensis]|uniref:hypothetical protein n=1 Tax=Enterobacteriaceae TaxID=543 RepID=UPI0021E1609A
SGEAFRDAKVDSAYRHFGVDVTSEAVLPWGQIGVQNGVNNEQHRRLNHSVLYCRDTQRALSAVGFGDPYTQQGRALVLFSA